MTSFLARHRRAITLIGDVIIINLSFVSAFIFRYSGTIPAKNFAPYEQWWPALTALGMLSIWLVGLYEDRHRKGVDILWLSSLSAVLTALLTMGWMYLTRLHAFPRTVVITVLAILTLTVFLWRLICSRWTLSKRVLIVGSKDETQIIARKAASYLGSRIFQIADQLAIKSEVDRLNLTDIDVVLLGSSASSLIKEKVLIKAIQHDVEVLVIPELYEILLKGAEVAHIDDSVYYQIRALRLSTVQRMAKRTIDILISAFGLLLSAWFTPVLAAMIKLDSPGPVFYSQTRVGRDGKIFVIHKFRSMVSNAEAHSGPVIAVAGDRRITRIGNFLRKSRLDEVPQLWNVLKGEMSLVGPRPERPNFVDDFSAQYPLYRYRLRVKPGITGLAQVEGKYSTDIGDKLRFDLMYIRNYSILLDISIILKTISVVLNPEKAEGTAKRSVPAATEVAATNEDYND